MKILLKKEELKLYLKNQLMNFFPDKYDLEGKDVDIAFNLALERCEYCFKYIKVKGYRDENKQALFSHLHSDQYSQFLYYFANSLWNVSENKILCDKLILLNRALHGIWISYKGELPKIFLLMHPLGTILGNAAYEDYLVVLQNVTVNTGGVDEKDNLLPHLGKGLFLGAGAKIIGTQSIGDWCSIGANTLLYKKSMPDKSVCYTDCETGIVNIRTYNGIPNVYNYFDVMV